MAGAYPSLPAALVPKRPCQTTTSFFIPLRWSTLYVIHPIPTMRGSISRPQRSSGWLLQKAHPPKQMTRVVVDGQVEPVHQLRWFLRPLLDSTGWFFKKIWPQTPSRTPLTYLPAYAPKRPSLSPTYLLSSQLPTYLYTYLPSFPLTDLPTYSPTHLSTYLATHPSTYLSITYVPRHWTSTK